MHKLAATACLQLQRSYVTVVMQQLPVVAVLQDTVAANAVSGLQILGQQRAAGLQTYIQKCAAFKLVLATC